MWDQEIEILSSGKVVVPGTPFLAGSGSFTDDCVAHLISLGVVSRSQAIEMATNAPRRLLQLPEIKIEAGSMANLILFDSNKDGFLSKEDTGPRGKAGGAPPRASLSPDENKERYKRADKDGDGKLTLEEAKTEFPSITEERFKERDVNGDGKLGPDDRKAGADDAAEAPAAK